MKNFEYADEHITKKQIAFAVPSMVIGVGVLTLPRLLATSTNTDGYISLIIAGGIAIISTWLIACLPSRFPRQSFFSYTSQIVTKPISLIITFLIGLYYLCLTAYVTRMVSMIAKQYLFDATPAEIVALLFLLTVIYSVSGKRVGVLRLNLMFIPIILSISFLVILLTLGLMEIQNLYPFFKTGIKGYLTGVKESQFAFIGGGIVLFYVNLVKDPKKVPKYAGLSMLIPISLYIVIHIACLLVFSASVTSSLVYPTIELAKEVQIPGGFFERFESLFFTVWIMAIFNTTAMAFDVSLMALSPIVPKWKKMTWIYILSPIIFILSMGPQNFNAVSLFGEYISMIGMILTQVLPVLLLILAKVRGIKGNVQKN